MTAIVLDVPQRSDLWFAARLGKLTGSRASDMLATLKSGKGEAAGRRNLRVQLVLERLTGKSVDAGFQSKAMEQGIEREEAAAWMYEALTGTVVRATGFIEHATLQAGCSLDGHVGDFEGLIELKSPIPATHLDYLRSGVIPGDYYSQVLHNLWITGAQWCDWMSFNPDFPGGLQAKIVRVKRNEDEIQAYEQAAVKFLAECDAEVKAVRELR